MPLRNRRCRWRDLAQERSGSASISSLLLLLLLCRELSLLLEMELSELKLLLLPPVLRQLVLLLPYMLVSCQSSLLVALWHLMLVLRWNHCSLRRTMLLYLAIVYLRAPESLRPRERGVALLPSALHFLECSSICSLLEARLLLLLQYLLTCNLRSAVCCLLR